MCSRFDLKQTPQDLMSRFGLTVPPPWPNRPEVRPTDFTLVVGPGGQGRLARFGLEVEWDKRPLINARAETLAQRPAFRRLLGRRVLVPASGWWEWRDGPHGKTRMRLEPADAGLFAFAGLMDGDHFAVVTCASAPSIAHVHDRMPVVLPPEAEAAWVDPLVPFEQVIPALSPHAGEVTALVEADPAKPKGRSAQGDLFG
ncbi:MAG: SOS response-associated peptidase [Magnetospirillum sp.]|nr:SOS response-associated peptidase [Magnetospirillum sp.]